MPNLTYCTLTWIGSNLDSCPLCWSLPTNNMGGLLAFPSWIPWIAIAGTCTAFPLFGYSLQSLSLLSPVGSLATLAFPLFLGYLHGLIASSMDTCSVPINWLSVGFNCRWIALAHGMSSILVDRSFISASKTSDILNFWDEQLLRRQQPNAFIICLKLPRSLASLLLLEPTACRSCCHGC
jgi:hypothetical protein